MTNKIGWKNHQWLKICDINISIKDRGLRFSDGIFETILIRGNRPILLNEHLQRLQNSLNVLNYNELINKQFPFKSIAVTP